MVRHVQRGAQSARVRSTNRPVTLEQLETRVLMAVAPLYYTIPGKENNIQVPVLASAGTDLIHLSGTQYGDGISTVAGAGRPNVRLISNVLASQPNEDEPNNRNLTDMIYAWGQFIDHDLDLTPEDMSQYGPISIPTGDPTFDPNSTGTQTMVFFRSETDPNTGTSTSNPLNQITAVTGFLDGSMIYGSSDTTAAALRTFSGGQLKTSAGDLLPINTGDLPVNVDVPGVDPTTLYLAGDVRVNENVELTAMQTLFMREHNYQAQKLQREHPTWTDEQLYQSARQIVIAEIQSITYNEFLPALLGANVIPAYTGYDSSVNPSIAAEFSEAAYRFGHSVLNEDIDFVDNNGNETHDALDFDASADNPTVLQTVGTQVQNVLKYLASDNMQEEDNHVENAFRNLLFDPSGTAGQDLYAIDIERGRDVGLPDYNTVRAAYGLPEVTSFAQITSDPTVQAELQSLYGNVNNIDLFVGGLAEDHVAGGSLGPTFTAIIANQFERTRDGDRLWYQNIFSGADLAAIQNTALADIIQRNTNVTNLQQNVFYFQAGAIGGNVYCNGWIPVGGITVSLYSNAGKLLGTTVTQKDGSYIFNTDNEDGGTYYVATGKTGIFSAAPLQKVVLAPTENSGDFIATANVALAPGPRLASPGKSTFASNPLSVNSILKSVYGY